MDKQPSARIVASSTAGEQVCAAAGRLSTTQGSALEILERSKGNPQNLSLIQKVTASGHRSLVEHAVFTIAFDQVSVCTEEFVIEFRLASFTVQSRRYVDFSHIGCFVPELPASLSERFSAHMQSLFQDYSSLLKRNIPKEDARFLLPYCFRSNFYCTLNARELMHMITAMLWGRGSVFPELRTLGASLKEQFEEFFPNLLKEPPENPDSRFALPKQISIADPTFSKAAAVLQDLTPNAAEILRNAAAYHWIPSVPSVEELIASERPRELEMITARFAVQNLSLAAVTHLVRHRMQSVLVPQGMFAVMRNCAVLPETIAADPAAAEIYREAFQRNTETLRSLLEDGLPVSAVQYFSLAGNQTDVLCCMNGRELKTFFALRTCQRAQWEIRAVAIDLLSQLRRREPEIFCLMGPNCYSTGKCPEGRLSCGRAEEIRAAFSAENLNAFEL